MKSLLKVMQNYVELMLDRVKGMKVLILDAETTGMISMVYSQSQILEKEVFLVERIESESKERMKHLNAVCLLRPTDKNFMLLAKMMREPRYKEYYLFFTNVVPHHRLENVASCDEHEVVYQVQELFCDVFSVTHDLFSLNQLSNIWMSVRNPVHWSPFEESVFQRHIEGLLAAILCLQDFHKNRPQIRFAHGSGICRKLASDLSQRLADEQSLFGGGSPLSPSRVLLIADRRDDPVTPLLNQWTYHAMVNELLGIENNRVDLQKVPSVSGDQKEISLSVLHDEFFENNMYSNFGDLGANVKELFANYAKEHQKQNQIESIEDMQRFMDSYPEFRKLSGTASKHSALTGELSRLVTSQGLLDVSQIEQDLSCTDSKSEHFSRVMQKLKDTNINNMERLRLVLLFALRYENDKASISQLQDELTKHKIGGEQVQLVDHLLSYSGSAVRGGDLFGNKTFWNSTISKMQKGLNLRGIDNVYTQHVTPLKSTVDALIKGKLREADYPFVHTTYGTSAKEKATEVLVFVVGGCTFEEARDMQNLRQENKNVSIVLGGSCIHSSKSFLADVAQLSRQHVQ